MKVRFILPMLVILVFFASPNFAQVRKVINYTEVGGLLNWNNSIGGDTRFNAFRVRTGLTKIVAQHLGLGIALGTDNYRRNTGEGYTALPITANGTLFLNEDLSGFRADVYGGYSVGLFDNFYGGVTAGAGISYSVPVNKGLNLGLQTGYSYQELKLPARFIQDKFKVGSLRLGLGITFK